MTDANHAALGALVAATPEITRIAPLAELLPGLGETTLLHAGPPFADPADLPAPMKNGVVAAARHEGFAADEADTLAALRSGAIRLVAAQDRGGVTPLAFVAGPSMFALEVRDPVSGTTRVSPLNDGPLPFALRFGTGSAKGLSLVREITEEIGDQLAGALLAPVPLLPVFAAALGAGDDLHGRVDAAQSHVRGWFGPLPEGAEAYLKAANQFVLNAIMAGVATMLGAAAGVPDATLVVAAGGNGRDFGWKLSGDPETWIVRPAAEPVGPLMPGNAGRTPLPAIGDSAVIDAIGFGAACLRLAPQLAEALEDHVDPAFFDDKAHLPFLGPHSGLPEGVAVGLDLGRERIVLGIMLGMVEAAGQAGLIGRGIAPWPRP